MGVTVSPSCTESATQADFARVFYSMPLFCGLVGRKFVQHSVLLCTILYHKSNTGTDGLGCDFMMRES